MAYERHPIEQIEGIGAGFGASLRKLGIRDTEDLLIGHPRSVLSRLAKVPRFPTSRSWEFRVHAELMQVAGITGQLAEGLFLIGRRSLERFAVSNADEVVEKLDRVHAQGRIPAVPDATDVLQWQKRALAIHYTAKVCGTVVDRDKHPVAGASVYLGAERATTNERGEFWIPVATYDRHELIARASGFKRTERHIRVVPGQQPQFILKMEAGADDPVVIDEAAGRPIREIDADDAIVFEDTDLESLPDGTHLVFRERYDNGTSRLLSVHRIRRDGQIVVKRVIADASAVAPGTRANTVFVLTGRALVRTSETVKGLRGANFYGKAIDPARLSTGS
jgi:hypothetical protein